MSMINIYKNEYFVGPQLRLYKITFKKYNLLNFQIFFNKRAPFNKQKKVKYNEKQCMCLLNKNYILNLNCRFSTFTNYV